MSEDTPQASEGVAEASVAESSSPAIDSPDTSVAEAASSPEETREAAPGGNAQDGPELPEFDFNAWEGSVDELPEMYHSVGNRMNDIFSGQKSDFEKKIEQLQALNDALMVGEEDPRVAQYLGEVEDFKGKYSTLEQQHEEYKQSVEKLIEQDAESYAQRFQEAHPEVFQNEEMAEALSVLIENDWEPEVAVRMLSLPTEAIEIALKAKNDGVPDSYALRLAESASRSRPKASPRPAAKITSGATTRSSPEQQMMDLNETSSLEDKRMIVARRALKNARR